MDKRDLETVSAAVDDELNFDQFAEWMATEEQASSTIAQQKWQNYHLIGDAMRSELPQEVDLDLSAKIMAAIDDEPAIVSPKSFHQQHKVQQSKAQLAAVESNIEVKQDTVQNKTVVVPFVKKFGQYAIAASVALFTVVGVQQYQLQQQEDSYSPQLNTRPIIGQVSPASLQTPTLTTPVKEGLTEAQLQEQRRRLAAYIQDHQLQQRLNSQAGE